VQYVPKYAWHIDPFGMSASFAAAWAQMNYSGWLFNRIDTRLKDLWHGDIPGHTQQPHLQFNWAAPTTRSGSCNGGGSSGNGGGDGPGAGAGGAAAAVADAAAAAAGPGAFSVFAHVLDTHYGAPEINYQNNTYHFDWEVFGGASS
jgi:hypothetical protein